MPDSPAKRCIVKVCNSMQREAGVLAGKPVGSELSTTFMPMSTTFMPMSDWITDRLPTRADGDEDNEVIVCNSPTFNVGDWEYEKYDRVKPGYIWRHTQYWTPPTPEPTLAAPEPEPELQHEIPEPIRSSATPFFVLMLSQPHGSVVQAHSTVDEALEQQARLGSLLGTTHIAECRIIPELTREVPADEP